MNLATFRVQFPEFLNAADTFVQAYLDAATLEVDIPQWTGQELGGVPGGGWCGCCGWSCCSGCTPTTQTVITGPTGQTKADQGQAYLAAHKMALSPWGQNARMVSKDGVTTYFKHYCSLKLQVGTPWIVA